MHGRRIVAGGHRKEHGQRLVHGATWEVGRVGAVAENVGSMEQRWVDYWEKKLKNDEKTKLVDVECLTKVGEMSGKTMNKA